MIIHNIYVPYRLFPIGYIPLPGNEVWPPMFGTPTAEAAGLGVTGTVRPGGPGASFGRLGETTGTLAKKGSIARAPEDINGQGNIIDI